jgi:heat shock protein HtpX
VTDAVDLFSQQQANRSRSHWLIAGFILFFAWLGFGGDILLYAMSRGDETGSHWDFPLFGVVLTSYALLTTLWASRQGSRAILGSAEAEQLLHPRDEAERQLINVVDEMTIAAGMPRPSVWVIPDPDPNAFATGRDEHHAAIAVTRGLLEVCSRDELQAVIGHELGHIKNYDTRLMTLLTAMVGAIAIMSDFGHRILFRRESARAAGSLLNSGRKRGGLPLLLLLFVLWIVSWLLAPLIARMLALGVSRKREFLADAMSAQFTRNPMALASALEKIERSHAPTQSIKRCAAHLCIADPLGRQVNRREGWLADLWGTHPPMAMRVSRLRAMAFRERKRSRPPSGEVAQTA